MDTIDCMRAFVAVAGHNSFTAGAAQLGISTKLASKYVRQLEERLGAQLLNRTTRSVTLTDTGFAYLERCTPVLDQMDEIEGLVQDRQSELTGPIRITAPTGFGSRELVRALEPFQKENPRVTIQLQLSDRNISIIDEGIDLAIRFGSLKDSSLVARKLTDMRLVVVASSIYAAQCKLPDHPNDLTTHNCLLLQTAGDPHKWRFSDQGKDISVMVGGTFQANSPRAIAYMAAAGQGIGRCPYYTAKPFLDNGTLDVLLEQYETSQTALYAVYPSNRHVTARIRALIDHLADNLGNR